MDENEVIDIHTLCACGQIFENLKNSAVPVTNVKSIITLGGYIQHLWVSPLCFSALQL